MKTKFILHGGKLVYKNPSNDSFFKAVTADLQDGDSVLFVGFARNNENRIVEIYERDKNYILAHTSKKIEVVNATYDNFIQEVIASKAIFITGGDTRALVKDIRHYQNFIDCIKGKIIAGSSAGACLFSSYYFFDDEHKIEEGLGVLPIKMMVHYGNEEFYATEQNLRLLKEHAHHLELVALAECEWITREIEI